MNPRAEGDGGGPRSGAGPRTGTVRNAGAMYRMPVVGTTPMIGAMIAPGAPARPAPRPNVSMNMRGVLMPIADAMSGLAMVARARRPNAVYWNRTYTPTMRPAATAVMTIRYCGYWYFPTRKFPRANGIPWVTAPNVTVIRP